MLLQDASANTVGGSAAVRRNVAAGGRGYAVHDGWIVELEWPGLEDLSPKTEQVLEMIEGDFDDGEGKVIIYLAGQAPIVLEEPVRISHVEDEDMQDAQVEIETTLSTFSMHLRFPDLNEDLEAAGIAFQSLTGIPIDHVVVVDFDVGLRNLDLVMGAERRVVYDLKGRRAFTPRP